MRAATREERPLPFLRLPIITFVQLWQIVKRPFKENGVRNSRIRDMVPSYPEDLAEMRRPIAKVRPDGIITEKGRTVSEFAKGRQPMPKRG